ncbi:Esterase [Drechslerella dactyloides]|uniref:Esterase n=1 Tax=Drechslerella dactyloides TaxID=74499 RepID=A0AAD6NLY0_DREDA|nr:Esterase [Drechslerella dactyloides]
MSEAVVLLQTGGEQLSNAQQSKTPSTITNAVTLVVDEKQRPQASADGPPRWSTALGLKRKSRSIHLRSKDDCCSTHKPSGYDQLVEKHRPDVAAVTSPTSPTAPSPSPAPDFPLKSKTNTLKKDLNLKRASWSPSSTYSSALAAKKDKKQKEKKQQYPRLTRPDRPISVDDPSIFAPFTMDSPVGLLLTLVPRIPLVGKTVAWHTLGFSQTSPYWDLRTEVAITMIRSLVAKALPDPIFMSQRISLRDPGIRGRMWIAKVPIPAPTGPETRQYVVDMINAMIPPDEQFDWEVPTLPAASAEWTGYRAGVAFDAPVPPNMSEADKYAAMMKEATSPVTVFYVHGGAMYLMDPATHRPTCARIAKQTKGRVLSLRYRLAPQSPFPAQLMDCFLGYLYLLYPPPGSLHEPVDPKTVVMCGDSAGANLVTALTALILQIRRTYPGGMIMHNGQLVELPLPAGLAVNSPWLDITHSFPSVVSNREFDYLPTPLLYPPTGVAPFPKDSVWPTTPPRQRVYVEDRLRLHPLVNPAAFEDWTGCPPTLIMCGQELLTDEARFFAAHLARQGTVVRFEEYQAMPHCFAQLMDWLPVGARCFSTWSKFISEAVEGAQRGWGGPLMRATRVAAKTLKEEEIAFEDLSRFTHADVVERMNGAVDFCATFHQLRGRL